MAAQTNHQIIKYGVEIKLTWWFVYEWGKPTRQIPHRVILKSPLPIIHYYQNKRLQVKEFWYLIPSYNWILAPISNLTCPVVTISPFQCTVPSTWLTNRCADSSTRLNHQLEKDIGCKVLQFITRWRLSSLVTKPYSVQPQQLLQEKNELGKILSPFTICMNKTLLHTCATLDGLQNNLYICLELWEKKA